MSDDDTAAGHDPTVTGAECMKHGCQNPSAYAGHCIYCRARALGVEVDDEG